MYWMYLLWPSGAKPSKRGSCGRLFKNSAAQAIRMIASAPRGQRRSGGCFVRRENKCASDIATTAIAVMTRKNGAARRTDARKVSAPYNSLPGAMGGVADAGRAERH